MENNFIKNDIPRDIDPASISIQALVAFMKSAISKHTRFRAEGKFMGIVWPEIGPTCTTEDLRERIVRLLMKKGFKGIS